MHLLNFNTFGLGLMYLIFLRRFGDNRLLLFLLLLCFFFFLPCGFVVGFCAGFSFRGTIRCFLVPHTMQRRELTTFFNVHCVQVHCFWLSKPVISGISVENSNLNYSIQKLKEIPTPGGGPPEGIPQPWHAFFKNPPRGCKNQNWGNFLAGPKIEFRVVPPDILIHPWYRQYICVLDP